MKKAVIYARVSTDKQEKQRTIESQLAELREVCNKNSEVQVVGEYTDDGYSGTTLVRPGLDNLRDDASSGLFQVVYILSPDRLARKHLYQLLVMDEFRKLGIEVMFLDKPVTDKPEDQLMLGIQGVIAEYERNLIVDRSRRGKLHRARNGEFMGGDAPYGYEYVYKSKEAPAHIRVNELEAEVVSLVFLLYLEGMSTTEVARELLRRKTRTKKGLEVWQPAVLHRMLTNETYTGTAYYNKCEGHGHGKPRDRSQWIPIKVPAIIDQKTFELVREISQSRRRTLVKKRLYILSGLLRCKYCGSRYSGTWHSGKYGYYRCMNPAKMRPLPKTCQARVVRAEQIEHAVMEAVRSVISDPEIMRQNLLIMAEKVREKTRGADQERMRLVNKRMHQEQQSKRLLDLYLGSGVSRSEYGERKEEIEEKIKELETLIEEVSKDIPNIDEAQVLRSVDHFVAQAKEKLGTFTPEKAQAFLRALLDKMTYDWKKKEVKLSGNIPVVGEDAISFQSTGATTPVISDKNLLKFELKVSV